MQTLLPGFLCIPIVLLARFVSVGAPIALIRRFRPFTPHPVRVLTWGGLRGAVSVALSLPAFPGRAIVLASTDRKMGVWVERGAGRCEFGGGRMIKTNNRI